MYTRLVLRNAEKIWKRRNIQFENLSSWVQWIRYSTQSRRSLTFWESINVLSPFQWDIHNQPQEFQTVNHVKLELSSTESVSSFLSLLYSNMEDWNCTTIYNWSSFLIGFYEEHLYLGYSKKNFEYCAKRQILLLLFSPAMPLINIENRIGPWSEPFTTPHCIGLHEKIVSFNFHMLISVAEKWFHPILIRKY